MDALHYHENVHLNPKILGFKIGHVKYSFFLSFRFRAQHVFMRFTALVIWINVFRPRTAFTDVFCRFRLVFFCFCASHEDENDAGGRYCHNLRWYDDRIALSFSVAIEFSIHAKSHLWVYGCTWCQDLFSCISSKSDVIVSYEVVTHCYESCMEHKDLNSSVLRRLWSPPKK